MGIKTRPSLLWGDSFGWNFKLKKETEKLWNIHHRRLRKANDSVGVEGEEAVGDWSKLGRVNGSKTLGMMTKSLFPWVQITPGPWTHRRVSGGTRHPGEKHWRTSSHRHHEGNDNGSHYHDSERRVTVQDRPASRGQRQWHFYCPAKTLNNTP